MRNPHGEYRPTPAQWRILQSLRGFRGATLSETTGPHWAAIYWHPNRPWPYRVSLPHHVVMVRAGQMLRSA